MEGVFFIVWGIKIFVDIRKTDMGQEILSQLPFSEEERKVVLINATEKFLKAVQLHRKKNAKQ